LADEVPLKKIEMRVAARVTATFRLMIILVTRSRLRIA
jgi:hypothetical protein